MRCVAPGLCVGPPSARVPRGRHYLTDARKALGSRASIGFAPVKDLNLFVLALRQAES